MRILIIGAGPLGSLLCFLLHQAGVDVELLARGERLQSIQQYGLQIQKFESSPIEKVSVKTISQLSEKEEYDLGFVIMRKNQAILFAQQIASKLPCRTIIFLGNNPQGYTEYNKLFNPSKVIIGFLTAAGHTENNITQALFDPNYIMCIGANPEDPLSMEKVTQIQEFFKSKGLGVDISPNIDAWLKHHAALVAPLAAILYQVNCDIYQISQKPQLIRDALHAMRDAMKALVRMGYPILPRNLRMFRWLPISLLIIMFRKKFATKRAELALAAHARSAYDEMEYFAREFKNILQQGGQDTPYYDKILTYFSH